MRKLRKSFLILTSIFSFLTAILSACCALYVVLEKESLTLKFAKSFSASLQQFNLAVSTIMNVTIVFFITSLVVNILFGIVYAKQSKLNYYNYYENKNGIWFLFALQLIVGIPYLASAFLLVVLLLPASVSEKKQLQKHLDEKQQILCFKTIIGNDPKLLSMSLQIGVMKRLLKTKQIDYNYYIAKINEIITNGVQF